MKENPIIGFIGLGTMGKPSAKHLMEAGYDLVVNDIRPGPVQELVSHGATKGDSPKEVAIQSDVIITFLPEGKHLKTVVNGEDGLIQGVSDEQTLIDMSTVGSSVFLEIADVLGDHGVNAIDAPVSGGEEGALNANLSIMVGGEAELVEEHRPLLEVLGTPIRIGDQGAGQVAKIANNMIAGANIVAVAEALVFAELAGGNPDKVYDAIKNGAARSWALEHRGPWMLDDEFEPGFKGAYHYKDMRIAVNDAQDFGAPMPISSAVHEMFKSQVQAGYGDLDESAVIKVLEWMAGMDN